jgi:hypothetical protein
MNKDEVYSLSMNLHEKASRYLNFEGSNRGFRNEKNSKPFSLPNLTVHDDTRAVESNLGSYFQPTLSGTN